MPEHQWIEKRGNIAKRDILGCHKFSEWTRHSKPQHLMSSNGIITKTSNQGFEETYGKLRSIIENNPNLKIILELDHAKNAASVDLELNPTRIIMFGNPKLGTPLMNTTAYLGLDLPQKILVTQGIDGSVQVSYNDPLYLQVRHKIEGVEEVLTKVKGALDKITNGAISA